MNFLKSSYNVAATAIFVLAIAIAHVYSASNYAWKKNTISDLDSQGYDRKLIMQLGFLAFGLTVSAGIALNGLTGRVVPIFVYGLCVALTGVFCARPFFGLHDYSVAQATIHSVLAQVAGVAFALGILVQLFYSSSSAEKWTHLVFFMLVVGFSAAFGFLKNYQGVAQRGLYFVSLAWLVRVYKP